MKKLLKKLKTEHKSTKLDPRNPTERKQIITQAVERTIKEYGEALKKLGKE